MSNNGRAVWAFVWLGEFVEVDGEVHHIRIGGPTILRGIESDPAHVQDDLFANSKPLLGGSPLLTPS